MAIARIDTGASGDNAAWQHSFETDLEISSVSFPKFSARNCEQVLELVGGGSKSMCRTIDGRLVYFGPAEGKYKSIIKCSDKLAPSFMGLSRGDCVTLKSIQVISETITISEDLLCENGGEQVIKFKLKRPFRRCSLCLRDGRGRLLTEGDGFSVDACGDINIPVSSLGEDNTIGKSIFALYQPVMEMMVTDISYRTNEWDIKTTWKIELEEV